MSHNLPSLAGQHPPLRNMLRSDPGSLKPQLKHFYRGGQYDSSVINLCILLDPDLISSPTTLWGKGRQGYSIPGENVLFCSFSHHLHTLSLRAFLFLFFFSFNPTALSCLPAPTSRSSLSSEDWLIASFNLDSVFFLLWDFGPNNTTHKASAQTWHAARHRPAWGWTKTHIFTIFLPLGIFLYWDYRTWVYVWQLSISPPSTSDCCFLTLQASEHGTVNAFSPAWSMPNALALLPALVPVCKVASHSYHCSLCAWTWCFPPPGSARRGMRKDVWSAWRSGWMASGPTFRAASPSAPRPGNTKWHRVVLLLIRCGQTWLGHKCKSSSFFSCL